VGETSYRVKIILNAQDKTRAALGGLTKTLGGVATAATGLALGAVAGVGALAVGITKLALDAAPIEQVSQTFDTLAESIGETADAMLDDLVNATRGMVNDADLMQSANQMMSMGLANTADEAAALADMATTLGMAMGSGPIDSMENFNAMLANQSIPRLDSFGISSGAVKARIEELTEGIDGLDRETAFMQAVMEQGTAAMERLGDTGAEGAAVSMAQLQATMANLKAALGTAFLPILNQVLGVLGDLASTYGPMVTEWAQMAGEWLGEKLPIAMAALTNFWYSSLQPALQNLAVWLGENIPVAIAALSTFWYGTLQPMLQAFAEQVLAQLIPGLKQLGVWIQDLAAAVLPLLAQAWAWVQDNMNIVLPILGAIGAAIVLLNAPIVAIIAAVVLLATAWANNWGGIQEKFAAVKAVLMAGVQALTAIWQNTLLPALQTVWAFVNTNVIPILRALANLARAVLGVAITALAGLWQNVLQPALAAVWAFISEKVIPIFKSIASVIGSVLKPVLTALMPQLASIKGGFDGISSIVQSVINWINNLASSISSMSLPDWLTPGSPTPFEMGLRGIAAAMSDVAAIAGPSLGGLGAGGAPVMGGMGMGGPIAITVNIGSVTEGNAYNAGQQAGRGIVEELRRQGVAV
jgi:phage-related protein